MSFTWFRKHEKTFLWITVVFTVIIFALFSTMDDLNRLMSGEAEASLGTAGSFQVETTGETLNVPFDEYRVTYRNYARLRSMLAGTREEISDEDVWAHIIMAADARGAGMDVPDIELARSLFGDQPVDGALYQQIVQRSQFPTLRSFESFYREYLLAQHWMRAKVGVARVVSGDDVYSRWRVDHERFDIEALVFRDLDPETIASPGEDTLRAYFDELPDFRRESLFVEPAKHDIAYATVAFDTDFATLYESLDELTQGEVSTPSNEDIERRFQRVKADRYPDAEEIDDAIRAELVDEVKIISLAGGAHQAFRDLPPEERNLETFTAAAQRFGMTVTNPDGFLGPEELKQVELIGDDLLPLRLQPMKAGDSQTVPAFTGKETVAAVIYLEDLQEKQPLTFEEAGDQVLEEWRTTQVGAAAQAFRDSVKAAAEALPVVQEAIAPLKTSAAEAAEVAIAAELEAVDAGPGAEAVTEERKTLIRNEQLALVQADIDLRIAEHEKDVWDGLVTALGDSVERVSFQGVPRSYRNDLDPEERDPADLEQFLKSNFAIFQLEEGAITDVLRLPVANLSAVVQVTGRSFPPKSEMLTPENEESMLAARQQQSFESLMQLQLEFEPAAIMASHDLLVAEEPEPDAPGQADS